MITRVVTRLWKRSLVDIGALATAFWAAYLLRFDLRIPADQAESALIAMPFVLLLQVAALRRQDIHRAVGRYISFDDLTAYAWAAVTWVVPMLFVRLVAPEGPWRIPVSVTLIDTVLAVAGVLAIRWLQRRHAETRQSKSILGDDLKPILLVGAGEAGAQVAREIRRHDTGMRVVGFADDDPKKHGAVIAGCEVLGTIEEIPELVADLGVDHVVVSIVDPGTRVMRRIAAVCDASSVPMRAVPGMLEIVRGTVSITKFRDVDIEDLLGRDPVELDPAVLHDYLGGRIVMVTGAGGSIGSELARQVAASSAEQLLLVEQFEGALFEVHRELVARGRDVDLVPLVADVTDHERMEQIFADYKPAVVVHAAAHKHVAMMEKNPREAVKNNVYGTKVVADLAGQYGAQSFVLVSTDKAVKPTSVMGATKRLAEKVVRLEDHVFPDTKYISVRFGNVMGSSGSVIPIFQQQVRAGGPVTVTHKDAERYFMTIPEASRLVLTAGAIGRGGEIMVLDMGEPIRILDLARNIITLSGYAPDEDIEIRFIGLQPGEKLREELAVDSEQMGLTRHPKIFVGKHDGPPASAHFDELEALMRSGDDHELRNALLAIAGGRTPDTTQLASFAGGEPR